MSYRDIPPVPFWLSLAGLIPFFASAAAVFIFDDRLSGLGQLSLVVYAAVVLSFLGGVRWGAAMTAGDGHAAADFGIAVLPSIMAWLCLLIDFRRAAIFLLSALIAVYLADRGAAARDRFPQWYGWLRGVLTLGASLALLAGWLAA